LLYFEELVQTRFTPTFRRALSLILTETRAWSIRIVSPIDDKGRFVFFDQEIIVRLAHVGILCLMYTPRIWGFDAYALELVRLVGPV
jgi:hypothetical protein